MVGVAEAAVALFGASCVAADNASGPASASATAIKDTLRITFHLPFVVRGISSVLTVPEEKSDENTNPDDGKSNVDVPPMQQRRGSNRAKGRKHQQKGRLARRQFFLFDHSRFTSLCGDAYPASPQSLPDLKFSLTLGSGTQSGPRDDTHVRRSVPGFRSDSWPPARAPRYTTGPNPAGPAFGSSPPP